jgi:ATP-dependent Zn protease
LISHKKSPFFSGLDGRTPAYKSGNPDGDDGSVWFWVPVFGLIFVILIAVVLYMWMQMYGGGGRDTL